MGRRGRNSSSTFNLIDQKHAVEVGDKIPDPPYEMGDVAKKLWERNYVLLSGVLSLVDEMALARYCSYLSEWLELSAFIAKEGLFVEAYNKQGEEYQAQRPECARLVHLEKFISRLEKDLGLTPAARGKSGGKEKKLSDTVTKRNKLFQE